MKKLLVVVVLVCAVFSLSFAKKFDKAVNLETSYLLATVLDQGYGFGVGFEQRITELVTAKAIVGVLSYDVSLTDSSTNLIDGAILELKGRVFPFKSSLSGLFGGVGIGLMITAIDANTAVVFGIPIEVGYKFLFDCGRGFFVEPIVGINIWFGDNSSYMPEVLNPGIMAGVNLGYSF